jgi:uncharacterized protein YndB with AHSA1/START domain
MTPATARWLRIGWGILAANLFGAAIGLLFSLAVSKSTYALLVLYPSLILLPMAMGLIAAYCWAPLSLRIWEHLVGWSVAAIIAPLGAYLFWHEGAVCLVIGSPLLFVFGFAGVMLGRLWFRTPKSHLQLSLLPLLTLAIFAEGKFRTDELAVMTDRLIVHAPATEVWKHVVAFPPITSAPDYWLNRIGLPAAVGTTCEGTFVGADRRCIFTNGLVFQETVSAIDPPHLLTFDIIDQPHDPELLGHLTVHRGQFELEDNRDGTTTLVGRSWYTLHMRPLCYFDWWARDITSHVHLRVMNHIRQLSEAPR